MAPNDFYNQYSQQQVNKKLEFNRKNITVNQMPLMHNIAPGSTTGNASIENGNMKIFQNNLQQHEADLSNKFPGLHAAT